MQITQLGHFRSLTLAVGVGALALAGCGDDGGAGSGDGTTEGSTSAATGDSSMSGMTNMTTPTTQSSESADSGDTTGDPSTGSSTGTPGDSSSGGPSEVTLMGEVEDLVLMGQIEGAEVSILDMPGFEATTDVDGLFTVGPIAPSQDVIFHVEPSTDYIGSLIPYAVPDEDDDGVRLGQIARTFLEQQEMLIEPDGAVPFDDQLTIVIVRLTTPTTLLMGNVTVDMQPAPAADTFYSPDSGGMPVLNSQEIQFNLIPVVVYYNVPVSAAGDLSFTATHAMDTCTTAFTDFPTMVDHITLVDIECS